MQEKDMVLDILSGSKASIGSYAKIITETGNPSLRQKFQQMRDSDERFQYNLYQVADQKGYYSTAPQANPNDAQMVKDSLSQSQAQAMSQTQSSQAQSGMQGGVMNSGARAPRM